MPGKPPKQSKPAPKALPQQSSASPQWDSASLRQLHGVGIPSVIYEIAMRPSLGEQGEDATSAYARDVIARMAPRDAAEEMLVAQLLFAHARVMRLTELANRQTGVEALRVLHEYADRASNTYRRLMLALAEYRRPPRSGDTFAVVKQTNIAGQQVIQNHEKPTTNPTNEQGFSSAGEPAPATRADVPAAPPALPADTGRAAFASFLRPPRETMDAVHRPPDVRRQGPVPRERDEAR